MIGPVTRFVFVTVCAVLAGCGSDEATDPEARIRAWVDDMQAHVEARERGDVVDGISEDYVDGRGNGRDDLENTLRVYFLRHNSIT
ncbi:MAG: hypothetical protein ACE5F8_01660, partial [Woeseiaceae bacterium]